MPPRNLQGKQQRRQSTYKLPVEEGIFLTKEKACDRITITGLCVSVTKKIPSPCVDYSIKFYEII